MTEEDRGQTDQESRRVYEELLTATSQRFADESAKDGFGEYTVYDAAREVLGESAKNPTEILGLIAEQVLVAPSQVFDDQTGFHFEMDLRHSGGDWNDVFLKIGAGILAADVSQRSI